MNATLTQRVSLLGVGGALSLAFAAPVAAEYRCDAPVFPYDRAACAEANKGPDSLRRFIDRTQLLYNLRFRDYMSQSDLDRYYDRLRAENSRTEQAQAGSATSVQP